MLFTENSCHANLNMESGFDGSSHLSTLCKMPLLLGGSNNKSWSAHCLHADKLQKLDKQVLTDSLNWCPLLTRCLRGASAMLTRSYVHKLLFFFGKKLWLMSLNRFTVYGNKKRFHFDAKPKKYYLKTWKYFDRLLCDLINLAIICWYSCDINV